MYVLGLVITSYKQQLLHLPIQDWLYTLWLCTLGTVVYGTLPISVSGHLAESSQVKIHNLVFQDVKYVTLYSGFFNKG